MKAFIIVLSTFLILGISCTYQRPMFSIRTSCKKITDSITHQKKHCKNYNYWGVKTATRIGTYTKVVTLDSLENKITVFYMKRNSRNMDGSYFRSYKKVRYYSVAGRKEKVTKYIKLNSCRFSSIVVDKTIYFENGKRIKSAKE